MSGVKIPSDEALGAAFRSAGREGQAFPTMDGLRAVATLSTEWAEREVVRKIDWWLHQNGHSEKDTYVRHMLRRDFPSAFTPTPEPAMPNQPDPKPTHDERTVRACIEAIKPLHANSAGEDRAGVVHAIARLESLLPTPAKPAPEWVTVEEVERVLRDDCGVSVGVLERTTECLSPLAATRGPMLTPEQAHEAARSHFTHLGNGFGNLLVALRRAATGGGD